jgi:hypothetical protein
MSTLFVVYKTKKQFIFLCFINILLYYCSANYHMNNTTEHREMDEASRVFVSHSSTDDKLAFAIVKGLEKRGIACWIAPRDVIPGAPYPSEIIRGINNSKAMVVMMTGNIHDSEFVSMEVERATDKKIIRIPLRFASTKPTGSLELLLSSSHWLAMTDPPKEDDLDILAGTLKKIPVRKVPAEQVIPAQPSQQVKKTGSAAVYWAIGLAIVAFAALGLIFRGDGSAACTGWDCNGRFIVVSDTSVTILGKKLDLKKGDTIIVKNNVVNVLHAINDSDPANQLKLQLSKLQDSERPVDERKKLADSVFSALFNSQSEVTIYENSKDYNEHRGIGEVIIGKIFLYRLVAGDVGKLSILRSVVDDNNKILNLYVSRQ